MIYSIDYYASDECMRLPNFMEVTGSLIDTVKFLVVRGVLAGVKRCKNGHIMNLVNYDNGDGCMWRCRSVV